MQNISRTALMSNLGELMAFISTYAKDNGASENCLHQLELASEEALVNIVHYAYKEQDAPGEISISCDTDGSDTLVIRITDTGKAFNMLDRKEPDTTLPVEERPVGGLGILLVKRLMDKVSYERKGNQNIITLEKRKQ